MKKEMLMGHDTPYLPEEITTDILKRLPVKSLIRFYCVSKQWKNLIRSPSFIANHLHHSTQNRPSLLLCKQRKTGEPLHLRLMDCEMQVQEIPNPPLISSLFGVMIIGSCNGLLCGVINEYDIPWIVLRSSLLLWNPATREIKVLPKTRTSEIPNWDCNGFGFSAIVNDYKIVQTYNAGNQFIRAVEVFSLKTGSWKEIELGPLEGAGFITGRCVSANGYIFWSGSLFESLKHENDSFIVSFDIAMEVFTLIPLPPLPNIRSFELTVYENKVAILTLSKIGGYPNYFYFLIDLWVLEEGVGSSTNSWSWTKKFSSNPCPSTLAFPGIIWRNEIVIGSFGKHRLRNTSVGKYEIEQENLGQYLINIITNKGRMIAIPGCRFGNVYNHVESLLSIGNI
ncbi:hypothetical protein QN277_005753 [Acacia crassicarpa]|uniref:F-box domain-containing protein n=1 Tax=Acacia crassicarpa TaxID=499986 RepID=A0AAE1MBI9_9FABA|nr:hypothetical protein QN277_005753 [Acacia crassicarpa]